MRGAPREDTSEVSRGDIAQYQVVIACKTGTAEFGDAKNRTHAWFTAFSEINNEPDIAVTVLVEAGGEGSDVAAPIARDIFEAYYNLSPSL